MPTLLDIFNNNWLNTQYVPGALPHFSFKIIILCASLSQFCLVQPKNYFLSSVFLRYFLLKHLPFFLFLSLASLPPFLPFSSSCAYILLFLLFVSALFLAGLKNRHWGAGEGLKQQNCYKNPVINVQPWSSTVGFTTLPLMAKVTATLHGWFYIPTMSSFSCCHWNLSLYHWGVRYRDERDSPCPQKAHRLEEQIDRQTKACQLNKYNTCTRGKGVTDAFRGEEFREKILEQSVSEPSLKDKNICQVDKDRRLRRKFSNRGTSTCKSIL